MSIASSPVPVFLLLPSLLALDCASATGATTTTTRSAVAFATDITTLFLFLPALLLPPIRLLPLRLVVAKPLLQEVLLLVDAGAGRGGVGAADVANGDLR